MSVPTHGVDCQTRTFPTKCSNCGDRVFYFSCSCGSQVFFDELGFPWPEHDCAFSRSDQRWARARAKTKLANGGVRAEISEYVTATRPDEARVPSWNIHPKVVDAERRNARSRESNPIESVPPGADRTENIVGIVREVKHRVDVYGRLELKPTPINQAFLGDLGSDRWGRVTIHVLEDKVYSYTAWAPTSSLLASGIRLEATVSARLEKLEVPGVAREWVCKSLELA